MSAKPASRSSSAPAAGAPPLAGVRIVDWTHILAGPYATYALALLGAEVIRIERHDECDITRSTAADPLLAERELGEGFVMQGAGKKSVAVDARDPQVKAALERLIARSDVLVENFRPGKMKALGFDPARLIEQYPQLVVCSVSGFGQSGSLAGRRAYDHVIQAASGVMAANRDAEGRPQRIGLPIIDYATGMQAALAVLSALHRRSRDQAAGRRARGEWLDVAMHEVALTLSAPAYASHAVSGIERKASRATAFSGNPLSGTFATASGYLAIVCNSAQQSAAFLKAMAAEGLPAAEVERLAQHVDARDVERTHAWLEPVMRRRTAADWEARLRSHEVPAAEALTPGRAYDEAAKANADRWPEVKLSGADGRTVRVPGPGFGSSEPLVPALLPPPLRGEHTREVLRLAGMDEQALAALLARGAGRQST